MTSLAHFRYNLLGTEYVRGAPVKVSLTEKTLSVGRNQSYTMQLEYKDLELDWKKIFPDIFEEIPELESAVRQLVRPYLSLIRGVIIAVTVSKDGHMSIARNGLNLTQIPPAAIVAMGAYNNEIISALQAMTFPLPGKVVPFGHTWSFDSNLFVGTRRRSEAGVFKLNFKYLGVRDRGGREEAVVEINGTLAQDPAKSVEIKDGEQAPTAPAGKDGGADANPKDGKAKDAKADPKKRGPVSRAPKGLYGLAHGVAHVDVASGTVTSVKLTVDLDVEMMVRDPDTKQDVPAQTGGTMDLTLKRTIIAQGR
jgi:hypothetical protein